MADDELVSHLLLVHGLHPEAAGQRVRRALEEVRGVTVLAADEAEVRVRIAPQGCGAPSPEQLAQTVRDTVAWAAPEVGRVETEDAAPESTLIPVDSLFRGAAAQPAGNR